MRKTDKIFLAGHRGMVGSAIGRALTKAGYPKIITRTHRELDLTKGAAVEAFFAKEKPNVVILAAAKVGGIYANQKYPAKFIYENLAIALNTIHNAYKYGASRLLFLGSSCIYPREAPQPIEEFELLSGPLERSNEAYAIAKIAGLKLCQSYRRQYDVTFTSIMPTNLYGPGDNYHPKNSHVLPALIRRFHEGKERRTSSVTLWGTGTPRREFLHVDDLAEACVFTLNMRNPMNWINAGTGQDISILELAQMVAEIVGYTGEIKFDSSKPDGTPRKLLNVTAFQYFGWKAKIGLREGITSTYQAFLNEQAQAILRT